MPELVYLATPYFHADLAVRVARFDKACKIAGELMREGLHVFCPIAHTHPIATVCDLPKGFGWWGTYDRNILSRCDRLLVVKMDGWEESVGVQAEIEIALELGLKVSYMELGE